MRFMFFALVLSLLPAASNAAVFVSVGIAPPVLPVYDQPPCPEPGWMWTPGYWAYGDQGYYWVPGTWVPAPYVGALWTPGYWGWSAGLYVWHPGYWGPHVGYYGGVNYGFGYMGIGFVGGVWHGGVFAYNTAVVHVNTVVIHNTYVDRTIVEHNTIVNDRHVAFSGGPGGIRHDPAPQERIAEHDRHVAATSFQSAHQNTAAHSTNAYFNHNGGHPSNVAVQRPLNTVRPAVGGPGRATFNPQGHQPALSPQNRNSNQPQPNRSFNQPQSHQAQPQSHQAAPQSHASQPHNEPRPESHEHH